LESARPGLIEALLTGGCSFNVAAALTLQMAGKPEKYAVFSGIDPAAVVLDQLDQGIDTLGF
jgi:hypothetical protein